MPNVTMIDIVNTKFVYMGFINGFETLYAKKVEIYCKLENKNKVEFS